LTKIVSIWNYKECVTVELADGSAFRLHKEEVNNKSKLMKKIIEIRAENQKWSEAKTKKPLDASLVELKELEGKEIDDKT
jgi:hypothetical protein